jgi:hypothetical protein
MRCRLQSAHTHIVESALVWSIAAVCALGLLIGLRYRAPALIAATAVTVLACVALGPRQLPAIIGYVLLLQCAYLAGLFLAALWRRYGNTKQ